MAAWRYDIFSSRVEKIFHDWVQQTSEIFLTLEEKFRISAQPRNILYVLVTKVMIQTQTNKQEEKPLPWASQLFIHFPTTAMQNMVNH